MHDRSEKLDQLATALTKVQEKLKPAIKDAENPFFKSKYADLSAVWDTCRQLLAENGITVIQAGAPAPEGVVALETILLHSSGQYISGVTTMRPTKNDPQGVGSCISYARRYALASMIGVVTEDDDGEGSVDRRPTSQTRTEVKEGNPAIHHVISMIDKVLINPKGGYTIEAGDKYHTDAKAFAELAKQLGQEAVFARISYVEDKSGLKLMGIVKAENK